MPSSSWSIPDLQNVGPVIDVHIGVSAEDELALIRAGAAVPTPILVSAMVDTGATASAIQEGLPAQLGLQPIGVRYVHTPSSANVACAEFSVRLQFRHGVGDFTVMEVPLRGQHIQCLIGRDVLAHAVLIYEGPEDRFTLCF